MKHETEIERLIAQAKEEIGSDPRRLNAHMQAITNGYSIALSIINSFITSKNNIAQGVDEHNSVVYYRPTPDGLSDCVTDIARKVTTNIYNDFLSAMEENKEKPIEKSN